jgi:regulator of replication initiation timing
MSTPDIFTTEGTISAEKVLRLVQEVEASRRTINAMRFRTQELEAEIDRLLLKSDHLLKQLERYQTGDPGAEKNAQEKSNPPQGAQVLLRQGTA